MPPTLPFHFEHPLDLPVGTEIANTRRPHFRHETESGPGARIDIPGTRT